jgi:hypothetical protein
MNTKFLALFLLAASCNAFVVTRTTSPQKTTSLYGFLEGRGKALTNRKDEDDAMWIPEPVVKKEAGKPAAKKAAAAKKPVAKKAAAKKPAAGGMKFPWEK